ncbi:MAG: glycosyltransferase family 39 protein [Bacteroidota bacterium]
MEQLNNKWHLPFKLFSISLALWLVLPSVFQYGMFMDGKMYSAIAKNIAINNGSVWNLIFSKTLFSNFYEHPPLAIFIHSLFYSISESFIIDKLYSLLALFLNITGICFIWKLIYQKDKTLQNYWWLPATLYLSVLLIGWAFKNNMLENTMSYFCVFSVYFILKAQLKNKLVYLIPAALLIILAFLSKGFTGLFPLSIPFFYSLFFDKMNLKKLTIHTLLLFFFVFCFSMILFLYKDSNKFLTNYFNKQVVTSIDGSRGADNARFFIVTKTFLELIPIFSICLIVFLISYFKKQLSILTNTKKKFFLFIALSATLPILLSPRQSGYYALCAYPFFALAFSQLIFPQIHFWFNQLNSNSKKLKIVSGLAGLILISSIVFSASKYKHFERDEIVLKDIFEICKNVPQGEIITIPIEQAQSWTVYAYFSRFGNISLDYNQGNLHRFYLYDSGNHAEIPKGYTKINLKLSRFQLFAKP